MNQAMVPVDGHKEEPQICVIEASLEFFFINLISFWVFEHVVFIHSTHMCIILFIYF